MKRFLAILAVCALAAAFLGGCGKDNCDDATEIVTEWVDTN